MEDLSTTTRIASRLGFKTKKYKSYMAEEEKKSQQIARKSCFLDRPRDEAIQKFPELTKVYEVQDGALSFYQDMLSSLPHNLNTNRRNTLRAQVVALEALNYLDLDMEIPIYSRENRQEEVAVIKEEEMRALRKELEISFEQNARMNHDFKLDADKRYFEFSNLFYSDEKKAIDLYPELTRRVRIVVRSFIPNN